MSVLKLSQLVQELKSSFESGEHNFKTDNAAQIMNQLREKYASGQLTTIDGIAIEYPTWRFGVRTSNTEPLLRLNLEAKSEVAMKSKLEEIMNFIEFQGAELDG